METITTTRIGEQRRAGPRAPAGDRASDGQLLDLFISRQDEAAFAELVRRHGAMVLGVCQRVLHNPHDAEDCFQAAFMVLVRKATSIQPREMVGNWLYGVAYRTALEARKMTARRRVLERNNKALAPAESPPDRWSDLKPVLDQELNRLPDKYRVVLIACDLEGKTRQQTAAQLGLPAGTVASRLSRARTMLAKRLERHKLTLAAGALALLLSQNAATAAVPEMLTATTVHAAAQLAAGKPLVGALSPHVAALTDGVVKGLLLAKLKMATGVLLVLAALGIGVGAFIPAATANRKPGADEVAKHKTADEPIKQKPELIFGCVLEKIDQASQKIQVAKPDDSGAGSGAALFEIKIVKDTKVIIDGEVSELGRLQATKNINVEYERSAAGWPTAIRIEATDKVIEGTVMGLNESTVRLDDGDDAEKRYELDKDAVLIIDGKKAKISDLKAKMKVTLHRWADKPDIVAVVAKGPPVSGIVTAIDVNRIAVDSGDLQIVAPDAPVFIDDTKRKLSDLAIGMRATLQMSAETEQRRIVGIAARVK